jgi:hypothetical protein
LRAIALSESGDVVISARIIYLPTGDPLKLRRDIVDGSLLDVFIFKWTLFLSLGTSPDSCWGCLPP